MATIVHLIFSLVFWAHADVPEFSRVQVNPKVLGPNTVGEIELSLTIPKNFKAFADQFKLEIIEPSGFKVGSTRVSPTEKVYDKFSKKEREVLIGTGKMQSTFEAPEKLASGRQKITLRAHFQTCTETYCNFPSAYDLDAEIVFTPEGGHGVTYEEPLTKLSWTELSFVEVFKHGTFWMFVFVFGFGVLTSFTPCIFPMIPITLAILGKDVEARTRTQNFLASVIYVIGISLTYALLGLFAASSGVLFGSLMSNPLVLGFICLVFLAMALSMFGLYDIQAPRFLRESRFINTERHGYTGVFLYGVTAGVVASPCVGPILVGILTYVAQSKDLFLGFWLLFTYSMGMGVLFIALGLSGQLIKKLPKSGPWMVGIKHFFGLLLVGAFFYYFELLAPQRVLDGSIGLFLIIWASAFGAFSNQTLHTFQKIKKGLLQAALIIGILYSALAIFDLRPFINMSFVETQKQKNTLWTPYSDQAFNQALESKRPIIIDFYADWCAACHELEDKTFTDSRVQILFSQFNLLRFDATKESEELKILRKTYEIVGLPTIIFIDKNGQWQKDLTLTAFEPPGLFMKRLEKSLKAF